MEHLKERIIIVMAKMYGLPEGIFRKPLYNSEGKKIGYKYY